MQLEPGKKVAKKVAKNVAKKVAKKVAEKVAKKVTKNVAKKVAKKFAKKVAKNVAKKVAEKVAKMRKKSQFLNGTYEPPQQPYIHLSHHSNAPEILRDRFLDQSVPLETAELLKCPRHLSLLLEFPETRGADF